MNGAKRDASHLSNQGVDSKKPRPNGSITSFFGAPKPKANDPRSAVSSPIATRFDKAKWVSSLTTEQKELLKLEIDTLDESWLAHLKEVLVTSEFLALKRFLKKEKESGVTIFPPEKDIYSW
jgi:uracil-DNA glycosylase